MRSTQEFAELVDAIWNGRPTSSVSLSLDAPIYFAFRAKGRLRLATWRAESDLASALAAGVDQVRQAGWLEECDCWETCLTRDYRTVSSDRWSRCFANAKRGLYGIELTYRDVTDRIAPSAMIATNRSFRRCYDLFLQRQGLGEAQFLRGGGVIRCFEADQYLIFPGAPSRVVQMYRGNRVIGLESLTPAGIREMTSRLSDWLVRHVGEDGQLTYKYWPSRGEDSRADNTIRQFLATISLVRLAGRHPGGEAGEAAKRNLAYNIRRFYREYDGYGTIELEGKAKLGATALAALAILESRLSGHYARPFDRLRRGIERLWRPNGSFRTFHKPAQRNDNQNFYPGEALLFWATLYRDAGEAALLERFMKSFAYYRDWHRANRNPAFVPWHSQAYAIVYRRTGHAALRDFVFEKNDWLLAMQQWDSAPFEDLKGRFYSPERPEYGPPHASSTGVYLEGLAEAYALAKETGDTSRSSAYLTAILRGLRSLRQLQFVDDVDMFYISKRRRVHGALRTEAYNNEIRVDNVAHCLIALLKLCESPYFLVDAAQRNTAEPRSGAECDGRIEDEGAPPRN